MKKFLTLALALVFCIGLVACGGGGTSWVGEYTMTDELGTEWTLTITDSEYQDETPGELRLRVGDMFSALEVPDGNIITSELLDSTGTATLELQSDGSIVVSCDAAASSFAPPVGIYTKK